MSIDIPVVSKFDPTGLKQAQGALGGFKKTLGTVAVALGAALSVRAVTNFAKASIGAASDLEESLNALSVSYGDASEGIAKLGEDAATRLGVTQSAFNQAAVRFSAFADRVVGEGGNVEGFVDDITTRAADFASVFNIDVAEALQVFQSGLSGEAEPLKRFGINLLQSEVQAYALQEGLISVGEQMTEDIKTQARYGLLMQETAKTQGDFANTSDGLANSQRILSANFEDMQATVGGALLPAFAALSAGLLPVVEQLGPVLGEAVESLTPALEDLGAQIPGLLTSFMPLVPLFVNLLGVVIDLAQAVLPILARLFESLIPTLESLMPPIMSLIDQLLPPLADLFLAVMDAILPMIEAVIPILAGLLSSMAPILMRLIEAFLPLIDLIVPILTGLLEFLIPILTTVADILAVLLIQAVGYLILAFQDFMDFLEPFTAVFEETFGGIQNFFYTIINALIGMWEGFANAVINGVNSVIRALNRIQVDAPSWLTALTGISSFGINIRELGAITLPRVALAEGGIVTGPMNALIGEAGPEAVIPLDKLGKMGNTYNITVNAGVGTNGSQVGEQIVNLIRKYERTSGPVFARA
jgi:phage-related protein